MIRRLSIMMARSGCPLPLHVRGHQEARFSIHHHQLIIVAVQEQTAWQSGLQPHGVASASAAVLFDSCTSRANRPRTMTCTGPSLEQ